MITGFSRGYAFVEFENRHDARLAYKESKELFIDDQKVTVAWECERNLKGWIPRRFGGGFGGKKESGQLRFGGSERPFRRPIPVNSQPLGTRYTRISQRGDIKQESDNDRDDCKQTGYRDSRAADNRDKDSRPRDRRHVFQKTKFSVKDNRL